LWTILRPLLSGFPEAKVIRREWHEVSISFFCLVVTINRNRFCSPSQQILVVSQFDISERGKRTIGRGTKTSPPSPVEALPGLVEEHFGRVSPMERLAGTLPEEECRVPFSLVIHLRAAAKNRLLDQARELGKDLHLLVAEILEQHVREREESASREAATGGTP